MESTNEVEAFLNQYADGLRQAGRTKEASAVRDAAAAYVEHADELRG